MWCVESGDLFKLENDQFVKIYNFEFDTSDAIRKLVIIDDRLFACSSKGLAYYEDGVEKLVQGPDPAAMNLYNVFKRSNGQILCGTLGGLYYLSGDSLVKFDELFHIDSPVYFILEDKDERLWFGTDRGVSRWNGSTLKHFSHLHGLAGHETNRSAGYLDSKNTVWIGTDHGISNYQPKYDSKPPVAPRLELTRVHVDSLDILETHQLNLEAGQNNIHIHVRCIAFTDEKNIKISYKLDGAGENWQVESPLLKPEIQYTNIAPGKYRFQIRAENVDGIQSEIVYSPYFRINLPLYKQAWFYALVAILFTSFVFLIYLQNSRRKQAELLKLLVDERTAELASTEQKLQEMFNQSRDIIFICSAKWDFLDINPAGLDIFGFEVKEKIFKKNFLLHLVENESERDKLRANIVQNGYIQNADVIVNSNSGSKVYLILSAYAVKDDNGEMTEIRCILKDVTERQQLTEQLGRAKRMESIGVLAGGIAHDFNNILSVIIGYADISLAEVAKESMLYKNIKAINDAAFRAKDLVRQILSFSRKKADEIKPVKVDSIVKEALKFLRSSIPSSIELISNIDKNIPHVLANPSQIHQVIMNLGTNAYQAIGEHVGKIHIELSCVEPSWDQNFNLKDGQYVMLKIKDSGNGMDPITLDKIFDPFFTTKPVGKGTGLGLSAVHGIIHSIGGTIQVTSEINVGSTFHVYLPVAKAEDIEEIAITNNIPGGNERILLVDDEVSVAKVVKQILSRLGYTVSVEHNSREALEHFKNDPFQYDLIITDQIMPEMTGLQLTKDILTIRPDMPIILTSGYSEKIDPDELRTLGIKGYIIKPATAREIAELIRQVMIKEIT
ncbi:MAG: response regulator [Calditrichaeota bacterium]|nr:MAG: response regulator [Calditrichota bacterium]